MLQHTRNRGKGAAIRTGLEQAQGQFTLIQDADLEYDPKDYPQLIQPLLSAEAPVVYGSRYRGRKGGPRPGWSLFRCGVALLNICVRVLYGARLTDEATCYKAFPTALLRAMDLQCPAVRVLPGGDRQDLPTGADDP